MAAPAALKTKSVLENGSGASNAGSHKIEFRKSNDNISSANDGHSENNNGLSLFSRIQLLAGLWTVALRAPPSMGFSRQEHWSGPPRPSPGDLPDPGIKPASLMSPASVGGFFTTSGCKITNVQSTEFFQSWHYV